MSQVRLNTNKGAIVLQLEPAQAPETCNNFVQYVRDGHYNGTIFHRVIDGFMIQGGGFEPGMSQRATRAAIQNEADNSLQNKLGTIAMARTPDPHSATAQFFINVNDNAFLDHSGETNEGWGYCVFGKVVDGLDVVQTIAKVATTASGMHQDVTADDVLIESAELVE